MIFKAFAFEEETKDFVSDETLDWLRLIRSENVGTKTFYSLIEIYGSAKRALEKVEELSVRGGRNKPIKICSIEEAQNEIKKTKSYGARIISQNDPSYPEILKQIPDAPPVLTILGNEEILKKDSIAIVGARNATANGCRFAYRLAQELNEAGYNVISGLARGIDTASHKGSLEGGTVAVIAGGIDNIYPHQNKDLYKAISEKGLIIAELPFGAAPTAHHFPQRNRIISGLSLGTVVVEAAKRSGSLISARLALEYGREVFAVPGSPLDGRSEGPNKLIKEGATLIESAADVVEAIKSPTLRDLSGLKEEILPDWKEEINFESENDNSETRDIIENLLCTTPVSVEEIISQINSSAATVQVVLLELELAGKLVRHPGGKVSLLIT